MKIRDIFLIILLIASLSSVARSQPNVERAVKEADRPIREEIIEEKLKPLPKEAPEIKKEEEEKKPKGPSFPIQKINLVGVESFPPEEFKPITERYENRAVTFEELNLLAKEIEREYLKRGIIAAVFVPLQEIKEEAVTLQVVESRMGELEIKDHWYFSKGKLRSYWQIKPGEILRYDKISRCLQHMNKNPDREAKATLYAGKKPGTTDVLLDVDTHFPIHFVFTFDREGSTFTGTKRTGLGIRHNNLLTLDDTLLSGYIFGSDFDAVYAYHKVPLTGFGTSVLYGYSRTIARPKKDYERFVLKSRADNASFFIYQALFKKDEYSGTVRCGLDMKAKTVRLGDRTSNRDVLRILRLGSNFILRGKGNITYINPEFSQGLDILGAKKNNPYPSRGAENTFSKYNLGIMHTTTLPLSLRANLNLKGQFATEKLTPQEEFSLGGIDSVRGYPTGNYLADNALQANAELLIPAFFIPERIKIPFAANPLKEDITGLVFFDYGYGHRREAPGPEMKRASLASTGAGIRIRLFNQGILRLEWGFPLGGHEPVRGCTEARFHISLNIEDRVLDELERIVKAIKKQR